MSPAKPFDLTAQFKVAADLIVVENTETVDDGNRATGHLDHLIRIQIQISDVDYNYSANNQLPQPDFHRQDTQPYGLRAETQRV